MKRRSRQDRPDADRFGWRMERLFPGIDPADTALLSALPTEVRAAAWLVWEGRAKNALRRQQSVVETIQIIRLAVGLLTAPERRSARAELYWQARRRLCLQLFGEWMGRLETYDPEMMAHLFSLSSVDITELLERLEDEDDDDD
jgi:hypothetical protein